MKYVISVDLISDLVFIGKTAHVIPQIGAATSQNLILAKFRGWEEHCAESLFLQVSLSNTFDFYFYVMI